MPNIKSAKKRLKQTDERTLRNAAYKTRVRTTRRKFMDALEAGDADASKAAFAGYCSALDKAAKHGVIAKNNAIRSKTRATKNLSASA